MKFFPVLLGLLLSCFFVNAQKGYPEVVTLTNGTKTSLRGLSVVNDNVAWVSGSDGMVGRTTNAGKTWKWIKVKGFERRDFRDIQAFDGSTAIIMSVDQPAYILKTIDGGVSWKVVYENKAQGMFLDAMEFWNSQSGVVIGDPVNGRFFITRTSDGGNTWQDVAADKTPAADSGEACFAASGTNVRVLDGGQAIFVSGGKRSRVFVRDTAYDLPFVTGKETAGANSISISDDDKHKSDKRMIVVGGDFQNDSSSQQNCFITVDGGQTWSSPKEPPHGYRSCAEYLSKHTVVTCGLTGVDYSVDNGKTFRLIGKDSYNVCRIAQYGPTVLLAGNNGRIGKLVWR